MFKKLTRVGILDLGDGLARAGCDDAAVVVPSLGAEVDYPVGGLDE
jgi:hypothetical protein